MGTQHHRVGVLGAGMVSTPAVKHLLRSAATSVVVIDGSQSALDAMAAAFGTEAHARLSFATIDVVNDPSGLQTACEGCHLILSLLPATMHELAAAVALQFRIPLLTASYVSPGLRALAPAFARAGTFTLNEMGLDPGLDILASAELLQRVRAMGGTVTRYVSLCGALPAPEVAARCPLGYKLSWSPRGAFIAATRPARIRVGGQWVDIAGPDLYHHCVPFRFLGSTGHTSAATPPLQMEWLPNGDAEQYADRYGLSDADTIVRGTIRYPSFAPVVRLWQSLGLLDSEGLVVEGLQSTDVKERVSWPLLLRSLLLSESRIDRGASPLSQEDLRAALGKRVEADRRQRAKPLPAANVSIASSATADGWGSEVPVAQRSVEEEAALIADELHRLGLLDPANTVPYTPSGKPFDALWKTMEGALAYRSGERDYVLMVNIVEATFEKNGSPQVFCATLSRQGGADCTATAFTVGLPVAVAAELSLGGGSAFGRGLLSPTAPEIFEPVLASLSSLGLSLDQSVITC